MTFNSMDFDFTFASEMNQMNRMMRCIGIWLLAGWGFISSIQGQDSAYLNMEARIENDTVVLEVRTIRFQDMIGTQFGVKFPSSNLSFIRGVAHPSLQGASVAGNPGNCLFSWMSPPQNPVSLADFTLLAEFRFHIDQPASEYCFEFGVPGFELRLRSVILDPHPARGIAGHPCRGRCAVWPDWTKTETVRSIRHPLRCPFRCCVSARRVEAGIIMLTQMKRAGSAWNFHQEITSTPFCPMEQGNFATIRPACR